MMRPKTEEADEVYRFTGKISALAAYRVGLLFDKHTVRCWFSKVRMTLRGTANGFRKGHDAPRPGAEHINALGSEQRMITIRQTQAIAVVGTTLAASAFCRTAILSARCSPMLPASVYEKVRL